MTFIGMGDAIFKFRNKRQPPSGPNTTNNE